MYNPNLPYEFQESRMTEEEKRAYWERQDALRDRIVEQHRQAVQDQYERDNPDPFRQ
jgi:uncharacterized protein YnzC (UPF0291/DUF896 family)